MSSKSQPISVTFEIGDSRNLTTHLASLLWDAASDLAKQTVADQVVMEIDKGGLCKNLIAGAVHDFITQHIASHLKTSLGEFSKLIDTEVRSRIKQYAASRELTIDINDSIRNGRMGSQVHETAKEVLREEECKAIITKHVIDHIEKTAQHCFYSLEDETMTLINNEHTKMLHKLRGNK